MFSIRESRLSRAVLSAVFLLGAAVMSTAASSQAPPVAESSAQHADWTAVLQAYVDAEGMVDYQKLFKNRGQLDRYLKFIEESGPQSTPQKFPTSDHVLAYYINAYNAQVFAGVLDRGPERKSVWRGLVSGLNFFVRMKVRIDGERTNLKNFEEKVVLKEFPDPRIHAVLNCASIGCPRLLREALEPETLQAQMDAAMTEWVNDSRHVQVDSGKRVVRINKIFNWFSGDFLRYEKARGTTKPTQIDYVNRFRPASAQIPRDYKIEFLPYDKGINAQ